MLIALLSPPLAFAQTGGIRSQAAIDQSAKQTAQETLVLTRQRALLGLVEGVKNCYSTTPAPAYQCIDLDIAGSILDTSGAKLFGSHDPSIAGFYDQGSLGKRLGYQYKASGATDAQGAADAAMARSAIQKELEKPDVPAAAGIPSHCKDASTEHHIRQEVPRILDLGPTAAGVTGVEFLADVPRVIYYPAIGQQTELRMIQCPIRVSWSNGHEDTGYYMEWEDQHQQIRVSFTDRPMQPPRS